MKDNYVSPGPSGGPGMELRDWFAGLAMQGFIEHYGTEIPGVAMACAAYTSADALLIVRGMSDAERLSTITEAFIEDNDGDETND